MGKDYYKILGVTARASEDEIKKAYRQKALQYHPDKNSATDAADVFKQVAEAYDVLSDPKKKSNYDISESILRSANNASRPGSGRPGFTYTFTRDPQEMFSKFFGSTGSNQHSADFQRMYAAHRAYANAYRNAASHHGTYYYTGGSSRAGGTPQFRQTTRIHMNNMASNAAGNNTSTAPNAQRPTVSSSTQQNIRAFMQAAAAGKIPDPPKPSRPAPPPPNPNHNAAGATSSSHPTRKQNTIDLDSDDDVMEVDPSGNPTLNPSGGQPQAPPRHRQFNKSSAKPDPPVHHDIFVSIEEVYKGASKRMKITRKVQNTDGRATKIEDKILTISIKPGWKAGTKITFPREGDQTGHNTPADIVFTLKDKPHPDYTRDGHDVIYTVELCLRDALCGTSIRIPTLDKKYMKLQVPGIIAPGTEKKLAGQGLPFPKRPTHRGNLVVRFKVKFPETLPEGTLEILKDCLPGPSGVTAASGVHGATAPAEPRATRGQSAKSNNGLSSDPKINGHRSPTPPSPPLPRASTAGAKRNDADGTTNGITVSSDSDCSD